VKRIVFFAVNENTRITSMSPLCGPGAGIRLLFPALLLFLLCASAFSAGVPSSGASDFGDSGAPIEVDADSIDYDRPSGRVTAVGNVLITCGGDELQADRVSCNIDTGDAYAVGNVVLTRGEVVMRKSRLHYNFKTRKSDADELEVDAKPFFVVADKAQGIGRDTYVLHNAKVTTCLKKHPDCHYHVRAKKVTVVPGDYLKARSAQWYFGHLPCMYVPYWKRDLATDSGFRFRPGYKSKMGAFLLSSYRQPVNPALRMEHRLDYRTERGFAIGESVAWHGPRNGLGNLDLYYLDDRKPIDDDEDAATSDIKNERYRFHLGHSQTLDPRTYMLIQGALLSDTDMLEDFFEQEYAESRQPENHVFLTRRYDAFTLSALANARLNDFYSNVNRLPEVSADFMRTQIDDSSVYYEGQTAAAFLDMVHEKASTSSDYSTFRLDTEHMFYQPRRYVGWLNVIPRAGYRGTYYSRTRDTVTTTDPVTTNTVTNTVDDAAALRSVLEVGVETSFKAFKTFDANRLRHVLEPYVEYTFAPEPNIKPGELYQFDRVDELDEVHQVVIGARNKLQTKRNGRPFDLADVDLSTVCHFEKRSSHLFHEIVTDAEFRPNNWLAIDLDGRYDLVKSNLAEINTRFVISQTQWKAHVEHRYRNKDNNVLSCDVTLLPNPRWQYNGFARYEFENGRVEEEGGHIQRNLDCLAIRLGGSFLPGYRRTDGTERDDEFRVMLEFWLTAFPNLSLRGRSKS